MSEDQYSIENKTLIIQDQDLNLQIEEPFELPSFPKEFITEEIHIKGYNIKIEREENGATYRAFLENKQGLLHGEFREFHDAGSLFHRCFYREGKLHGPSEYFSPEGLLLSKSWFYDGLQVGKALKYYLSGKLYAIGRYDQGKLHGLQEYYFENGGLKTKMEYDKGVMINEALLYWSDGKLKRRVSFKDETN